MGPWAANPHICRMPSVAWRIIMKAAMTDPEEAETPMTRCECQVPHTPRRIAFTGGPGAGKTATLELIRQAFCRHVMILPEAAGILFRGGFPRNDAFEARRAAQRAIFYTQRELEATCEPGTAAILLCDRGTVDGLAYWPGPEDLWEAVGTTLEEQLARYDAVIHLRTPPLEGGYDHSNPVRIESAVEAAAVDARILAAWAAHPRRYVIDSMPDFLAKAARVLEALRAELPPCCREHVVPALSPYLETLR